MSMGQLVLAPFKGFVKDETRVLRFKLSSRQGGDLESLPSSDDASIIRVLTPGIYSVSAALRFQCTDSQGPVSNGWGITLNSNHQGVRNVIDMPPATSLAKLLIPEPQTREAQREPIGTLTWVGRLKAGDELRVESERPEPRLYQGVAEDPVCFFRAEKLIDIST